ncbi:hypothetical protein HPB47_016262 [Ixodes persulcatus]|uniref:Uncharacterized protein n=1 Tax=Ixodes persulcatus TaxID=34615 RepID=A0AC60QRE0_IXOPE|nr:hypothetical protein HPB47_016262 [Ixodes persulcatus]
MTPGWQTHFDDLMKKDKDSMFIREASVALFSTAGLLGRSVTGTSSNRTKSTPKPALDAVTLLVLTKQAEEAAIALALATTPHPRTIISDSKAAILNYAKGYVSTPAQAILRTLKAQPLESAVSLVWTPAHSGLCGNELAHSTARGFTTRAEGAQLRTAEIRSARDSLVTFHDITSHFRLTRRIYPPAAPVLSREESIMWRQLQTHSFPCPLILSHIYPPLYTPNCSFCEQRATLSHILWECPFFPPSPFSSEERWEAALRSSDPATQLKVVRRAAKVAEAHGLSAIKRA